MSKYSFKNYVQSQDYSIHPLKKVALVPFLITLSPWNALPHAQQSLEKTNVKTIKTTKQNDFKHRIKSTLKTE